VDPIFKDLKAYRNLFSSRGSKKHMKASSSATVICLFLGLLIVGSGCADRRIYGIREGEAAQEKQTATLRIPYYLEVISVDGEGAGNFLIRTFRSGDRELRLLSGPHTLDVRYNDSWPVDAEDREKIVSAAVALNFQALPGKTYVIHADEPKDLQGARAFASRPSMWLSESRSGQSVSP
jgi:hypothetical protein